MNLVGMISWLLFVTDCDKTLVHYESYDYSDEKTLHQVPLDQQDISAVLIQLPASSGSQRIGHISTRTLDLLDEISEFTSVVCATGMRVSTMMQRQPFMSSVKYWLCENGGRIFEVNDEKNVVERFEWQTYLDNHGGIDDKRVLNSFAAELKAEGWYVDQRDYESMFRIKITGENLPSTVDNVINKIPSQHLKYTFNLDYIDVYIKGSGKYNSVEWLKSFIGSSEDSVNDNNECNVTAKADQYYFMGDDTNDVEIASKAKLACIVMPCSDEMQQYINSQIDQERDMQQEEGDMLDWLSAQSEDVQRLHPSRMRCNVDITADSEHESTSLRPTRVTRRLYTAPVKGYRGTESNLELILARLKSDRANNRLV